jgi:hypothetical protein
MYAPFQTLEQENQINPQKRQMDYQYNGRLFLPAKTLQIKQNNLNSLEGFYAISNFTSNDTNTELSRNLKSKFFTDENIQNIIKIIREKGGSTYITNALVEEIMRKTYSNYVLNDNPIIQQLSTLNNTVAESIINPSYIESDKRLIKEGETTNKRAYDLFYGENQHQPLNTSIITNQIEPNKLTATYFSKSNLDKIQSEIIKQVKEKNGKDITRQSDTQVQIIMRSIYLQFGKNNRTPLKSQLEELNNLVVEECVRIILPNIEQYSGYIRDITNPIPTVPIPESSSNKGRNTFSLFV